MTTLTPRQAAIKFHDYAVKLKRVSKKATLEGARVIKAYIDKLSPTDSGELKRHTLIRKISKGHRVLNNVRGDSGYPYAKFVNQSKGYETAYYPNGQKRFGLRKNEVTQYGSSPSWWKWSGTPKFFDLGVKRATRYFPELVRRKIQAVIK